MEEEIEQRIINVPKDKNLTVVTQLTHFSIITYLVKRDKLRDLIPIQFDIYSIIVEGEAFGLVSAVTFVDKDFRFKKLIPFLKLEFPQTNYRTYIIDKETGENCAWFFGTGLGSPLVYLPQKLWKMPWFFSKYKTHFKYSHKYTSYKIEIFAENSSANIYILEDEEPNLKLEEFNSLNEAKLILTHPVTGYFLRSDKYLGRYKIWHPKMEIKTGQCKHAYFEKFEKIGLLTKEEMKHPYSVLITKEIDFIIDLPPVKLKKVTFE